jgi:hypothetical protein
MFLGFKVKERYIYIFPILLEFLTKFVKAQPYNRMPSQKKKKNQMRSWNYYIKMVTGKSLFIFTNLIV